MIGITRFIINTELGGFVIYTITFNSCLIGNDAQPTMRIPEIVVGGTAAPNSPNGEIQQVITDKPIRKNKIRRL